MIDEQYHNYRFDVSRFLRLPFVTPIFYEEATKQDFLREYFVLFLDTRDKKIKIWFSSAKNKYESGYGILFSDIEKNLIELESISELQDFPLMVEHGEFFIAQIDFLKWVFGDRPLKNSLNYLYNNAFLQHVTLNDVLTNNKTISLRVPNTVTTRSDVLGKRIRFDGTSELVLCSDNKIITFLNANTGILLKNILSKKNFFTTCVAKMKMLLKTYRLKVALVKYKYTF